MTTNRDKRDECNCHRDCTVLSHACEKPCRWPDCLTPEEHEELLAELLREGM